jgi:hypothetical protein
MYHIAQPDWRVLPSSICRTGSGFRLPPGILLAFFQGEESAMKPSSQNVANDPTIMGNERPRRELDDDNLPKGAKVQEEDPRNGINLPLEDADSDREEEKDEV